MVKIIGIDPGLAETGVGIIIGHGLKVSEFAYGNIQTPKTASMPERLHQIFSRIHAVLESEKPHLMIVEDIFSLKAYPKSGITLGKVVGVILVSGYKAGISVSEIPVREAKQVLTGNGNASKYQLEKAVRYQLQAETPIHPFHASDALALALIGLYRYGNNCPHYSTRKQSPEFSNIL